jgi:hypothetical protein
LRQTQLPRGAGKTLFRDNLREDSHALDTIHEPASRDLSSSLINDMPNRVPMAAPRRQQKLTPSASRRADVIDNALSSDL